MPPLRYHHVQSRIEQGILVLTVTETHLRGDTLVEALRAEMLAVVNETSLWKVVLDLAKVTSVASEGFRPLLNLRSTIEEHGGRLLLCNLSPVVNQTLRTTRLISSSRATAGFEVQPNVEAALATLGVGTSAG